MHDDSATLALLERSTIDHSLPTASTMAHHAGISKSTSAILTDGINQDPALVPPPSERITYKQALSPPAEDESSSKMVAKHTGDYFSVKIDENLVQQEADHLQNSLIGKIFVGNGRFAL